ncbi:MAG: O-antigen ligase family protein [Cyclobacteriaceae bacterium]|jgi:O-antigen ligase
MAIALLIIGWLMQSPTQEKWMLLRSHVRGLGILLLFVLYVISLSYSADFGYGLSRLETKVSLLAFPLILFSTRWDRRNTMVILRSFVYAMLLIASGLLVVAAYKYNQTGSTKWFFYHELTEPIDLHAIYFANYLMLGLLLVINIPDLVRYKWWVASILVILIFLLTALTLIGFLFLVGLVSAYLEWRKRYSPMLVWSAVFGIILISIVLALSIPGTRKKILQIDKLNYSLTDPDYAWNSVTFRLALWECAAPVIANHLFIGVGIGDENQELQRSFEKKDFREGIRCNYDVHNQYLSTWMSIGIIGLVVLAGSLIQPAWLAFHNKDWLMLSFIAMTSVSFATESFLSSQKGIVFFSFFYSLLMARLDSEFRHDKLDYAGHPAA